VITSVRLVGVLLISSLIVIPNITAMMFGKGFKKTLLISIFIAVLSVVVGIVISYVMNLAPGGTIVIISVGVFLAVISIKYFLRIIKGEIERHRKQVNTINR
jgi:zinc transport system permease protein